MNAMQALLLVTGLHAGPTDWTRTLARADRLVDERAYGAAELLYRQLLQSASADLGPLMRDAIQLSLAEAMAEQGRLEEAAQVLRTARTTDAGNARRFQHTARHYAAQWRETERALQSGLRLIRSDPASPWGWRGVIDGLLPRRRAGDAIAEMESLLGRSLRDGECLALAAAADDVGAHQAAARIYQRATARHVEDRALRDASLAHSADHGTPAEAIVAWRAATLRWPEAPELRLGLVRQLERDQQWFAAIAQLELVLAADRRQFDPLLRLAVLLAQSGQAGAAREVLLEHIGFWPEAGPSDPRRHVQRDDAYSRLVALLDATGAVASAPSLAGAQGWTAMQRLHFARALRQRGHLAQAVDVAPTAP